MKKLFITIFLSLLLPLSALAINVTEPILLKLPSSGENYTLDDVTKFTTLVVNNANFQFTLAPGEGFRIHSSNRRKLANDQNIEYTCNSSESVLSYVAPSTVSSITVTITPSSDTCSSTVGGGVSSGGGSSGGSSSGGGGGGGSGGGSSAPDSTVTPTPKVTPTAVPSSAPGRSTLSDSQIQAIISLLKSFGAEESVINNVSASLRGAPAAAAHGKIISNIARGSKGEDVRALQEFLKKNKDIYPEGNVTGYFGSLTKSAVKRFQQKYGIEAIGTVGPKTRAKINELIEKSQNP